MSNFGKMANASCKGSWNCIYEFGFLKSHMVYVHLQLEYALHRYHYTPMKKNMVNFHAMVFANKVM